jgi:hypothetical protein
MQFSGCHLAPLSCQSANVMSQLISCSICISRLPAGSLKAPAASTLVAVASGVWKSNACQDEAQGQGHHQGHQEDPPFVTEAAVTLINLDHNTCSWSSVQHLQGSVTALSVLVVEHLDLVIAAGKGGKAFGWSLKSLDTELEQSHHNLSSKHCRKSRDEICAVEGFPLPPATYRGLTINEVVELR